MDLLKWIVLGLCIALATAHNHGGDHGTAEPEPEGTSEPEPEPQGTGEPEPEEPYHGYLVGSLSTNANGVSGMVHVADAYTIKLTSFNYNGMGPDTFFFVGTSGDPSSAGTILPHYVGAQVKLGSYEDAEVTLMLPESVMMGDIVWFSVWCRQAQADFGSIRFPANLMIPAPVSIGDFMNTDHEVAGTVTILDHKRFRIDMFSYDGAAPDAHFYVGMGAVTGGNTIVADENGSMAPLGRYSQQTVVIMLPTGFTVFNIDWLSVWCEMVGVDFGHVMVPDNPNVPAYTRPMEPMYYGTTIGPLSMNSNGVSGMVHVIDSRRILVTDFNYDGMGPDTFFFVGTSGNPSGTGTIVPHFSGAEMKLGVYQNEDLVLTLPNSVNMGDIMWFSVWCRDAQADFGSILFPADLVIPAPVMLGAFMNTDHAVDGMVTILDHKRFRIDMFSYDGEAPDAHFYVGEGAVTGGNTIVADENGSMEKLGVYSRKTIVIMLPAGITVFDIDWLSVWCEEVSVNFGDVMIPDNPIVPVYVQSMMPDMPMGFLGTLVGPLSELEHMVSGTVYIASMNQLHITNFNYDGEGPDARFYVGFKNVAGVGPTVSSAGMIINNEMGMPDALRRYENENILLTLPEGKTVNDIMWFSIWCEQVSVDFGSIVFPDDLGMIPMTVVIADGFVEKAHDVRSGTVTFINERQVYIMNFNYDGTGPDAFFWAGMGNPDLGDGFPIPNEMGSTAKLSAYSGETIMLTLPMGITWYDVEYLSVWCHQARANFGHVILPQNMLLPPFVDMPERPLENCMHLHDYMEVQWEINGDYIYYEFAGNLEGENGYMSIGQSADNQISSMDGADVNVAYWGNGMGQVDDYSLTAYAQCNVQLGVGACPDNFVNNGMNEAEVMSFRQEGEFTYIRFRKPLMTGDDADIDTPANGDMQIVWAMGILGADGRVTKHNLRQTDATERLRAGNNCEGLQSRTASSVTPWPAATISGETQFLARIGPTGGDRGYTAITSQQSWGIAWWINGYLIPEITMVRGRTYTFTVEGGANEANNARYHPFYITNDQAGGYFQKDAAGRAQETVYAGVDSAGNPTAAGRLCQYEGSADADEYATFMQYRAQFQVVCEAGSSATLTFTPDDNTPDTIYYQCFTHRFLGWRIKVVDPPMPDGGAAITPTIVAISVLALLSVFLQKLTL